MVENKHFTLENIKLLCLDQTFDNVTCCIPSFDFRAPSAQACIVSALSPIYENMLPSTFTKNRITVVWIYVHNFTHHHFPCIFLNAIVFVILSFVSYRHGNVLTDSIKLSLFTCLASILYYCSYAA